MTDRLKKEDFVRLLAARMKTDEATATAWVDGIVETLYESFKAGQSVTLPGFGGFYVRPERNVPAVQEDVVRGQFKVKLLPLAALPHDRHALPAPLVADRLRFENRPHF